MAGRKKYPSDPNIDFDETLRLIVFLRDSWRMVVARIAEDPRVGDDAKNTPAADFAKLFEQTRNDFLRAMRR